MSTTNTSEKPATKMQPSRHPVPDGKSELPAHNLDFPTPGSTGSGDSGDTVGK
jgi:hypothetical protein